jgi:hypothetical protein
LKPVAVFFALTVLLLAFIPLLSITTGLTMDFDAAAAEATKKTGIDMTSNLLVVSRLAIAEPALALLILGSAVPALTALIVCLWTRRPSPLQLLARLRPIGTGVPRIEAVRAYGLLFVYVPLCLLGAYVLRMLLPGSTEYVQREGIFGWGLIIALLTAAFLD